MGVTILTLESYNQIFDMNFGEMIVFLKFGADWCIPCNELEKNMSLVPNSIIYHISIENEEFEDFFIKNEIFTVPYTIIKYQTFNTSFKGLKTTEELINIIDTLNQL